MPSLSDRYAASAPPAYPPGAIHSKRSSDHLMPSNSMSLASAWTQRQAALDSLWSRCLQMVLVASARPDTGITMLRTGQGGRPPPRLYRQARLPPAAGHRRRHRRRADVPAARGPGQHRPRRRPLPAGDGGTGALRRGQRTTHATGRQRVLHSWRGIRLPQDGCRFSITIRRHKSLRNLIEEIPEDAWTPIPYWMDGAADVAETTCTPFQSEPDAAPVRLIVRRVKPTPVPSWPSSPPTAITASSPAGTGDARAGGRPSPPRRDRECHPRPQSRCGVEPSPLGRFPANAAWLAVQVMAHNIARWTARIGLASRW